jgi:hypothetical protein
VCVYIYTHTHIHKHGWNIKYSKTGLYRAVRQWQLVTFTLIWAQIAPRTAASTHFTKHRITCTLCSTKTEGQASVYNCNRLTSRHAEDVNLLFLWFWRPSIKRKYQLSKDANVAADVWERHGLERPGRRATGCHSVTKLTTLRLDIHTHTHSVSEVGRGLGFTRRSNASATEPCKACTIDV